MPTGTPNSGFIIIPPITVPINVEGLVVVKSYNNYIPEASASRLP